MTPEKFKELRLRKKYTQKQVAMKLGVSQRTVSYWEHGARPIRPKYKKKLKEIFKVKRVKRVKRLKKKAKKPKRSSKEEEENERQRKKRAELMRRMDAKAVVPGSTRIDWGLIPDDDEDLNALRKLMNIPIKEKMK